MIFQGEKALSNMIRNPHLGDCPYTLFLGAGASLSSEISLTSQLVEGWKNELFEDLKKQDSAYEEINYHTWSTVEKDKKEPDDKVDFPTYNTWKKENNPERETSDYSLLFSTLFKTSRQRQIFIEQLIDDKKPTFGYMFLAGLINAQRFNRILTTNFDDLLADAMFKWYSQKPITCAFDSMVSGIRVDSLRPKIIKLHGDFLYDNLKNIRSELRSLDTNMESKMLEMCKDKGLIVVGYAGGDKSVMHPINEMLRKSGYLDLGVHWCFMESDTKHIKRIIDGEEKDENIRSRYRPLIELYNQYSDQVSFYKIKDFDSLMETMFMDCDCNLPDLLDKPEKVYPYQEFHDSVHRGKKSLTLTKNQHDLIKNFYSKQENKNNQRDISNLAANLELFYVDGINRRDEAKKADRGKKVDLLKSALNEFLKCREIVEPYCQDYSSLEQMKEHLSSMIYAFKRLSGVCVSIAKAERELKINGPNFLERLQTTIDYADKGIQIFNGLTTAEAKKNVMHLRSLPYNACCAFSLATEKRKDFKELDQNIIFKYFELDIKLVPDKKHAWGILEDPDFAYLKKEMGDAIIERFKM